MERLDLAPALRDGREQLERVSQPGALFDVIARIDRVALELVGRLDSKLSVFASSRRSRHASRSAVVISHERQLRSRSGCTRMNWTHANAHASSTTSCAASNTPLHDAHQPRIEGQVQVGLVAQEPSSDLLGDGTRRVVRRLVGAKF